VISTQPSLNDPAAKSSDAILNATRRSINAAIKRAEANGAGPDERRRFVTRKVSGPDQLSTSTWTG
jgi:hypothetical protein